MLYLSEVLREGCWPDVEQGPCHSREVQVVRTQLHPTHKDEALLYHRGGREHPTLLQGQPRRPCGILPQNVGRRSSGIANFGMLLRAALSATAITSALSATAITATAMLLML